MILKIDHLGIAGATLDGAAATFEKILGLKRKSTDVVASQRVRTAFYPCDAVNFELLEPTSADSPIAKHIEKRGEGFHHVAFETDDIRAELARLKTQGVQLIDAEPRPGAHGTQIAFLHPKATNGLLIELVQRPRGH